MAYERLFAFIFNRISNIVRRMDRNDVGLYEMGRGNVSVVHSCIFTRLHRGKSCGNVSNLIFS